MNRASCFFFLWLSVWLLIPGCGEDTSSKDDIPPQVPIYIPRSDDAVYPQRGIRPEPTASNNTYWVRLEWQRNPETDVKGYIIRRGAVDTTQGNSYPIADLEYVIDLPDLPSVTEHFFIDRGLNHLLQPADLLSPDPVTGDTRGYYWLIQAYDESGNRSALTDSIFYRLVDNPADLSIMHEGPHVYRLMWNYPGSEFISFYKIRVYAAYGGPDSIMWDPSIYRRYQSQIDNIFLNEDSTARPFVRDCTYVWQLNAVMEGQDAGAAVYRTFVYED